MVRTFQRSERLLMWVVIPISAGGVLLAGPIIQMIFGAAYTDSVAPFRVMCLALIPIFLSLPRISLLNAIGKQRASAVNLAVAIVAHVACSVTLIPRLGIIGAALSFVISNLALLVLCQYSAARSDVAGSTSWAPWVKAIAVGTVAMVGAVWVIRDRVYLPLVIALGAAVYVCGTAIVLHRDSAASGTSLNGQSFKGFMAALRAIR